LLRKQAVADEVQKSVDQWLGMAELVQDWEEQRTFQGRLVASEFRA
jgi:hypothetical protein